MAGTKATQHDEPSRAPAGDAQQSQLADLELLGGRVCLDFVNSVDPRVGDQRRDYLTSYTDLVRWSAYAHLLTEEDAAGLLRVAERSPREAAAVFERAILLREALYRIFTAHPADSVPSDVDLDTVRTAYVRTLARGYLAPTPEGYRWRWPEATAEPLALERMLWPLAESAVELLTSPESRRVKVCPGLGDCGWLFLDTSKSGRRRWCSMESCGSRSKMRRYYARTRTRSKA